MREIALGAVGFRPSIDLAGLVAVVELGVGRVGRRISGGVSETGCDGRVGVYGRGRVAAVTEPRRSANRIAPVVYVHSSDSSVKGRAATLERRALVEAGRRGHGTKARGVVWAERDRKRAVGELALLAREGGWGQKRRLVGKSVVRRAGQRRQVTAVAHSGDCGDRVATHAIVEVQGLRGPVEIWARRVCSLITFVIAFGPSPVLVH